MLSFDSSKSYKLLNILLYRAQNRKYLRNTSTMYIGIILIDTTNSR
jgi:hypothetical protein